MIDLPVVTATKSFHYVELSAESLERAVRFYGQVFGWRFAAPPDEHAIKDIMYFEAEPEVGLRLRGTSTSNSVRPGVAVDSIAKTLALVEEAGGRVLQAAQDVGDGFTGYLEDTEGNTISLWEFK